MNQMFPI